MGISCSPRVRLALEPLEDRCLLSSAQDPALVATPNSSAWAQYRMAQISGPQPGNPTVLFLGDSILDGFANDRGADIWNNEMAPYGMANDAISGNTTHNVLWQLVNGELNFVSPQVVVLMIGINNLAAGETPEQTAEGVSVTVSVIQALQPQAQILLLGILPAAWSPYDPVRGLIQQTNNLIAGLDNGSNVHYADIGAAFEQPDGSITPATFFDGLHPTEAGYQTMADALWWELGPLLQPSS